MQNYVGQALQNLSGTVEGIGRQGGENRLRTAELGLKRATQALQIPGLKLQAQENEAEIAQRNQPVNVKILMQKDNPESIFHILGSQTTKNMPPPYQAVGNIFGATVDEQGNYIVDGRPLTNWEFNQKAAQVQRTMGFYTDPKKAMTTRSNMAQKSLDSGIDTRTGQPLDEKMKMNLAGGIEKVGKMTDSDYLRGYEQQLADMEASKAPFIDGGGSTALIDAAIGRVQGKIDSYKATITKASDREYAATVAKQAQADKKALKLLEIAAKDTRSKFQKDVEFAAAAYNITEKEATDMLRADKTIAPRLKAYTEALEPFAEKLKYGEITEAEYTKKDNELWSKFGLGKEEDAPKPKTELGGYLSRVKGQDADGIASPEPQPAKPVIPEPKSEKKIKKPIAFNQKLPVEMSEWDVSTTSQGGKSTYIELNTGTKLTQEEFDAWVEWDKEQLTPVGKFIKKHTTSTVPGAPYNPQKNPAPIGIKRPGDIVQLKKQYPELSDKELREMAGRL